MQVSEAFSLIIELATARGFLSIKDLLGCCEFEVDDHWWVAINGKEGDAECSRGAMVPRFHAYVEFNGWPAGLVSFQGGTIAYGEAANEDTFIAALEAALAGEGE